MYYLPPVTLVILGGMGEEKFSRYELKEELGQGGMATVYRAYDPLFEREVALKILKKELLNDTHLRERFERETKIIAKLEHAAIVPVYDVGRDNDQLFFVMRYMAGGSLSERIQSGKLTFLEIAHILQRVASALDYAHEKGVIHRDLKPGNVLFDEYNNAFISDFGIAKFSQASIKLTSSGIIGTPAYMSPEQARGEDADGRSDIYSMGIILYEMLSGKTPFEATTPLGMAFKHASDPIPNIRDVNPNLPESIEEVFEKVLAKESEDRYALGADFANAFITTLPAPLSSDVNLLTPVLPRIPKSHDVKTTAPSPDEPKDAKSATRLWMIAGVVALLLVIFSVWAYPRFIAPPPPTPTIGTATKEPLIASTATLAPLIPATVEPTLTETISPGPTGILIGGADKIAFTANKDIYLVNVDGSDIQQLTNTNVSKFDLQWLPGGEELLYGEAQCVYKINLETNQLEPEQILCLKDSDFDGFRVSPDGKWVAISVGHRLLVLPFDLQTLSTVTSAFELQGLKSLCLDYSDDTVKGAEWSADGRGLAVVYQSVVNGRIGDTIRVMRVDLNRCQAVDPIILDEFPAKQFIPDGYLRYPILPAHHWDGAQRFLFNSFKRNASYGELYLYDMSSGGARIIDPVDGVCCYGSAAFSPDGTHILFVFQDERKGENSEIQLYYVPFDQIGTGTKLKDLGTSPHLFPDLRELVQIALRTPPQ